ncbi:cytochrome P450 [Fodinicola feengrottensis]|uniref:cytochrome P450 n=1 Tax=Fodinicola feengrottensis TaxID=435914 RepID=UPI0013D49EE2|nr:cytochrome P450 [Fodinicola feengrottensis]
MTTTQQSHDQELAQIRENTPVCPVTPPHGVPTWLVTRYDHARAVLVDPRISKDMHSAMSAYQALFGDSSMALDDNMIFSDGPKHTRLRRLVAKAFTPRRVEALRPRTQQITDQLLDAIGPYAPVNLVEAFTFPLPITVICELLGVPADMRADFQRWSTTVAGTVYDDDSVRLQQAAEEQMHHQLVELVALKRKEPGDDLLTDLIAARGRRRSALRGRARVDDVVAALRWPRNDGAVVGERDPCTAHPS